MRRKRLTPGIRGDARDLAPRLLLAAVEDRDGKRPAAVEHYRKALEVDQNNVAALNNLAYLLAESNQADEALKYAQQAKELAPDNPTIDDTLGWTHYRKGLYSSAVKYLESAVAKDGTARRRYHLGMAYMKAGEQKKGQQALEAALKLDPKLPEAEAARER
jgi:Flp pilus assembly protein TadD